MKSKIINVALFTHCRLCMPIRLCLNILLNSETLLLLDTALKLFFHSICLFLVNVRNASRTLYPTATMKSKIINVALFTYCRLCVWLYSYALT